MVLIRVKIMDEREILRHFIANRYAYYEAFTIRDNDSLSAKGYLDSEGMLELIAFVERRFSIKIDNDEINFRNIDSLAGLANLIRQKKMA